MHFKKLFKHFETNCVAMDTKTGTNVSMSTLGERIKEARVVKGLNRMELARLSGVSVSSVQSYELDRRAAKAEAVTKLAHCLEVSADWLISGKGPRTLKEVEEQAQVIDIWDRLLPKQKEEVLNHLRRIERPRKDEDHRPLH